MSVHAGVEPRTRGEWQEAVDAAEGALALDAARQYGLVSGGPDVDADRCADVLERGRLLGYAPAVDAVERFVSGLADVGRIAPLIDPLPLRLPLRPCPPREPFSQR